MPITPDYPRDMVGHGRDPPQADWPGGARIAVQFVLNLEEGGENCVLHGDTGSELMAWLRTRLQVPISGVVISAVGRPELIAAVHAAGLDFLAKPVKPAALRALISRHLHLG